MSAYFSASLYFLGIIGLTLFSFTQVGQGQQNILVGLALTLILTLFLLSYFFRSKISRNLFLFCCFIGFLAFPTFLSNDIFTYAIYGKILVFYHQLPWLSAPVNFPIDSWSAFSHWPTSTSRYGPVWIAVAAIAYIFSLNHLVLASYLIKLFSLVAFAVNVYLVGKIAKNIGERPRALQAIYYLNPYIFIESVASPHSDVMMTMFVLAAIYLYFQKDRPKSYFFLALSAFGIKIISLPLALPVFLRLKKLEFLVLAAYIGPILISARWSINPWYFYLPITLSVFVWKKSFFRFLALSLSIASLVRYLPYFYLGFFDPNNKIRRDLFLVFMIPFGIWFFSETHKYWLSGKWRRVLNRRIL